MDDLDARAELAEGLARLGYKREGPCIRGDLEEGEPKRDAQATRNCAKRNCEGTRAQS